MRKEISIEERKKVLLSIMLELDEFCKTNNIVYYLVGGTLLGAIRHKGFIPWDDDMDIALPRDDYEKLVNAFVSKSGKIRVINHHSVDNYRYAFSKADHKDTQLYEKGLEDIDLGVNIDVFPLDILPGNYNTAKRYLLNVNRLRKLMTLKQLKLSKKRSIIKNIILVFLRPVDCISNYSFLNYIDNKCAKFKNCHNNEYVAIITGQWGIKEISKLEYFKDVVDVEFEGHTFNAPKGYHSYLTDVYGDYMTPPPPESRVSHHETIALWRS